MRRRLTDILRHVLTALTYVVVLGILSPILDMRKMIEAYRDPWHWIICLAAMAVVYPIVICLTQSRKKK
jgi:hypothetical protein